MADPVDDMNAVNKRYLINYINSLKFYATTNEHILISKNQNLQIKFDKFSGTLLDQDMKLKEKMYMKISFYCEGSDDAKYIEGIVKIGENVKDLKPVIFSEGDLDDKIIFLLRGITSDYVKPHIEIERIS